MQSVKNHGTKQCRIQQFFGGASFSTSVARRKTVVQPRSLGRRCKPSQVASRGETRNFWPFCVLKSSKHRSLCSATRNVEESLHQKSTLLSVWRFEFGIANRYTSFKIALDTALLNKIWSLKSIVILKYESRGSLHAVQYKGQPGSVLMFCSYYFKNDSLDTLFLCSVGQQAWLCS